MLAFVIPLTDEFDNSSYWLKNMAERGQGTFPYMALVKPCKHSKGHIYCTTIMKLGQKICPNDKLEKFKKGSGCLKNMAARAQGMA